MDLYLNESTKIDGENYVNQKFKVHTLMERYNVSSIMSRYEAKPTSPITSIQDWKKRETKEKVLLRMLVKDNIIPHIQECKTYKEIWDLLKGLDETTNTNRILFLKSELLSIKVEENENVLT